MISGLGEVRTEKLFKSGSEPKKDETEVRLLKVTSDLISHIPTTIAKGEARWSSILESPDRSDPQSKSRKIECRWPGTKLFISMSQVFPDRVCLDIPMVAKTWELQLFPSPSGANFSTEGGDEKFVFDQISEWVVSHAPYRSSAPMEIIR